MKLEELRFGTELLKRGFASMQKGGVIMDVVNAEQAKIAEAAGAVAVMSLERVPSDIRKQGGVARMADPEKVTEIIESVSIPVMGKVRIGHFVEAQVLEGTRRGYDRRERGADPCRRGIPYRQEAVQGPVCLRGAKPWRGAAPGERRCGDDPDRRAKQGRETWSRQSATCGRSWETFARCRGWTTRSGSADARSIEAPAELVIECAQRGRLPVVNFSAGGIATPSDAALMMQLGADGVFVGSGIFKSTNPEMMAKAIVEAVNHYKDAAVIARVSRGLGDAMPGLDVHTLRPDEVLQTRGR